MNRPRKETETTRSLLADLVTAIINYPEFLTIKVEALDFSTLLSIVTHANDAGKVCGHRGRHIKAIKDIFAIIGRRMDLAIRVSLLEPVGQRTEDKRERKENKTFDPTDAGRLLFRLASAMTKSKPSVSAKKIDGGVYFVLTLTSSEDYRAFEAVGHEMTVREALGSLWEAYGNKEGITFHLDIVPGRAEATAQT